MTTNTFLSALRKGLSAPNKALLDAIENDPLVQGVIEKAAQSSLTERRAMVAELAAVPARHAKAIKLAVAESISAAEAERRAEEVLIAARARRVAASGAASGLEAVAWQEADRLERALRAGAPNLLVAAARAVRAFDPTRFAPDQRFVSMPRHSGYDERGIAEHNAAREAADVVNNAAHRALLRASGELNAAAAHFDAMAVEALTEAEVAESVSLNFRSINLALESLKDSPRFEVNEHMECTVKFGADQTVFTIKPADVNVEVKR